MTDGHSGQSDIEVHIFEKQSRFMTDQRVASHQIAIYFSLYRPQFPIVLFESHDLIRIFEISQYGFGS